MYPMLVPPSINRKRSGDLLGPSRPGTCWAKRYPCKWPRGLQCHWQQTNCRSPGIASLGPVSDHFTNRIPWPVDNDALSFQAFDILKALAEDALAQRIVTHQLVFPHGGVMVPRNVPLPPSPLTSEHPLAIIPHHPYPYHRSLPAYAYDHFVGLPLPLGPDVFPDSMWTVPRRVQRILAAGRVTSRQYLPNRYRSEDASERIVYRDKQQHNEPRIIEINDEEEQKPFLPMVIPDIKFVKFSIPRRKRSDMGVAKSSGHGDANNVHENMTTVHSRKITVDESMSTGLVDCEAISANFEENTVIDGKNTAENGVHE